MTLPNGAHPVRGDRHGRNIRFDRGAHPHHGAHPARGDRLAMVFVLIVVIVLTPSASPLLNPQPKCL